MQPPTTTVTDALPPHRDVPEASAPSHDPPSGLQALLVRWFVTYNPIYLASAAMVLLGITVTGDALLEEGRLEHFTTWGIAEAYELALIGAAAVLARTGRRRPAVMLGLLAALFQGDLVMHAENAALLALRPDEPGWPAALVALAASGGWLVLFVLKGHALTRALAVRLSRSVVATAIFGAVLVTVVPHAITVVPRAGWPALVALPLAGLAALALWGPHAIIAVGGFDVRGRRVVLGLWALGALAIVAHLAQVPSAIGLHASLLVAALFSTRFARHERTVWIVVGLAVIVASFGPTAAAAPWIAASVLLLRGWRKAEPPTGAPLEVVAPYRGDAPRDPAAEITELAAPVPRFAPAPFDERLRLSIGAITLVHCAVWRQIAHDEVAMLVLAVATMVGAIALVWTLRRASPLAITIPSAPVIALRALAAIAPTTALGWGVTSVAMGFALLGIGVGVSLGLPRRA